MRTWLLPLVLLAATPSLAAKPSATDRREGLPAGTSKKLGRQIARRIAVMSRAPVTEHSVNPGVGFKKQIEATFKTGTLVEAGTEDGVTIAEVASLADEYGAPHFRTTTIVMAPVEHGPSGVNVSAALDHTTSKLRGWTTTESHEFQVEQPKGLRRGRRVRLHPEAPITSTTATRELDFFDSGHARASVDMALTPSANRAFVNRMYRVVRFGEERPNVGLPDEVDEAPASAPRR